MAATVGLTADQVYGMTVREVEVYIEGRREHDDWMLEVLAWLQANLINVHVPRGKARVKAEALLPRSAKRRRSDATDDMAMLDNGSDPRARLEAAKARARAKREREEAEHFANSPEGRRMVALLGEPEEP